MRDCRYSGGIFPLRNSWARSSTPIASAAKLAIAKNQPTKASGRVGMLICWSAAAAGTDGGEYALQQRGRRRRAAGYGDIHRDDIGHAAKAGIALAEYSPAAAAVADRHHQLGRGHGVEGAPERLLHVARHRS